MNVTDRYSDNWARDMGSFAKVEQRAAERVTSGRKVTFTRDERMHDIAIVPLEPAGFAIVSKHHYDWMLANGYGERWTAEVPFDDFVPMVCAPSADGRTVSVSKALDANGWACAVVKV